MMKSFLRSAPALGLAAMTAFAAACSGGDALTPTPNAPGGQNPGVTAPGATGLLTVRLESSNVAAVAGQRIAIGIVASATTAKPLGGLQGRLAFDASKLKYVGQTGDAVSPIAVVNASAASTGSLRVASVDGHGLAARTATLVFDVLASDYAASVRYEFQAAGTLGQEALHRATVVSGLTAGSVTVPASPRLMGRAEWLGLLNPNGGKVSLVPGETNVPNLKYGDANLSGGVDINDALDVALLTVGTQALIAGTDGTPGKDMVVAANVAPANLPGLGEPGDALPPGFEGGSQTAIDARAVDINDALEIALFTVGSLNATNSAVNQLIPGRVLSAPTRVVVSCPITANTTWTANNIYELPAPATALDVCEIQGASLTINAGTRIESDNNTLVVRRDAQIFANGTYLQPIVLTCKNPQTGVVTPPVGGAITPNGTPTPGCQGGLYVNGNAPINNGTATSPAVRNSAGGCIEVGGEGGTGLYGGCDANDNSGVLRFLRVENAGTRFSATNERNAITLQGIGRGTTVDYLDIDNGLDDGIEFFGGTVNVKHILVRRSEDDGFDWVGGWSGKAQFVIVRGCDAGCDRGIEADNFGVDAGDPNSLPRSNPTLYNFTLVGAPAPSGAGVTVTAGMELRQNTAGTLRNFIVANYKAGLDIDQPDLNRVGSQDICDLLGNGTLSLKNAIFAGNTAAGDNDGNTAANDGDPFKPFVAAPGAVPPGSTCGGFAVGAGRNDLEANYIGTAANAISVAAGLSATDILVAPFAGFAAGGSTTTTFSPPDFSPKGVAATAIGATPPNDGFFDATATFLGAVRPGSVPWYSGWTLPSRSN